MPFDLELSNHELSYISKKAEQWRGEEGERRKVAVYDYVWEEEEVRTAFLSQSKCPAVCVLIVQCIYLYYVESFACLEFKAASTRMPT